jgi:molybdate-binding protein/DNA-binding XRE family transcriptional regulator
MPERLDNQVRPYRDRLALSQQALADIVGVSRQAIVAIEGGRTVPSTGLSLRLARALRCAVEDLFAIRTDLGIAVRLAPDAAAGAPTSGEPSSRVAVAEVDGKWVAHRLPFDGSVAADGIIMREASGRTAVVRPLADSDRLRSHVLLAGCAPLLGALAQHAGLSKSPLRVTWLHASSGRALDLLHARLVHVAGLHLRDSSDAGDPAGNPDGNIDAVRKHLPGRRLLVANLTRWRAGLIVAPGNPLGIRSGADLLRPGLRVAKREEGAAAHQLLLDLMAAQGVEKPILAGPFAAGHADVATLVAYGAADVGVAMEGVALAAGLGFVPLGAERFDLVMPAEAAGDPPVARLLELLADPNFRADVASLPGYDSELCGQITTLEAA